MPKTKDGQVVQNKKTYYLYISDYKFSTICIRKIKRLTGKNKHLFSIEYHDYSNGGKRIKAKWDIGMFNMFLFAKLRFLDEQIKRDLLYHVKQVQAITDMSRSITSAMIIEGAYDKSNKR